MMRKGIDIYVLFFWYTQWVIRHLERRSRVKKKGFQAILE